MKIVSSPWTRVVRALRVCNFALTRYGSCPPLLISRSAPIMYKASPMQSQTTEAAGICLLVIRLISKLWHLASQPSVLLSASLANRLVFILFFRLRHDKLCKRFFGFLASTSCVGRGHPSSGLRPGYLAQSSLTVESFSTLLSWIPIGSSVPVSSSPI